MQPKDKSNNRKTFLKVRDARARSQFSKLQKKAEEDTTSRAGLQLFPAVASADSNEAFLAQLMDPFEKPKSNECTSADSTTSNAADTEKETVKSRGISEGSRTHCESYKPVERKDPPTETESTELADTPESDAGASVKEAKGYIPFLKAQKAFEAKQREKDALRLARMVEAEKELTRRKEKEIFKKVAHKKLQARTRKGQLVMGNVMDVMLLKLQNNARKN